MKTRNFIFVLLLALSLSSNLVAQSDTSVAKLTAFVENVNTLSAFLPQEKVYVHTDNSDYFLGETIWFKAYVVLSGVNTPTEVSKVLYVELLTPEGEVVETRKLEIVDGQCAGDIYLDTRKLYSGFYELRAYTRYMTNFGSDYAFSRVLPVYSFPVKNGDYSKRVITGSRVLRQQLREKSPKLAGINISFFSESGHLIQGLMSNVAFKVTDNEGKSVEATGVIYNAKGEEKSRFSTIHNGMGVFSFTPENEQYTVEIESGKQKTKVKLPLALPQGYVMSVKNLSDKILTVQVQKSNTLSAEAFGLAVMSGGKIVDFYTVDFGKHNTIHLECEKTHLQAGVGQVILFNQQGQVLADRLIFIQKPENLLSFAIKTNKSVYAPFEKVNADIQLVDNQKVPVKTVFSLSVRDNATSLESLTKDNIYTCLLLGSEIKGLIEKPSWYFEKDDRNHRFALDLLMLTQGWRRYKWEELSGTKPLTATQKAEKRLLVSGSVRTLLKNEPKPDLDIELIMNQRDTTGYYNGNMQLGYGRTDKNGYFEFQLDTAMRGQWDALIQVKEKGKQKNYHILLDRFSPQPMAYSALSVVFTQPEKQKTVALTTEKSDISVVKNDTSDANSPKIVQLQEVEIVAKSPLKKQEERLSSSLIMYDVRNEQNKIMDEGLEEDDNVLTFLARTNPYFTINPAMQHEKSNTKNLTPDIRIGDPNGLYKYASRPVMFLLNNQPIIEQAWKKAEDISMSRIAKIVICDRGTPLTAFDKTALYNIETAINAEGGTPVPSNSTGQRNMNTGVQGVTSLERKPKPIDERDNPNPSGFDFDGKVASNVVYIFLYTNPNYKSIQQPKGVRNIKFDAFAVNREFYHQKYDISIDDSNTADHRRTLYWNPNLKTDENGKANIEFYNNSTAKGFIIDAQTITKNGEMGSFTAITD